MIIRFIKRIIPVLFLIFLSQATFAQPLSKLQISDNKRFITDENGNPFFWLGDTGWLLFSKTTRQEAETYLKNRNEKGFNVVQVMLIHDLKAAINVYGDSAFKANDVSKPKETTGTGNIFSDSIQYDYWDHVDYIVDLAEKYGIYMATVPVWGSNVKAGLINREQAEIYATFLATRFKHKQNIIWLNGGDVKGSDSTEIWKSIGSTLRQSDPNHLITFHPYGRHSSSLWFNDEPWLDFNMFQSGHRNYFQDTITGELHFGPDNWKYVQYDLSLSPLKPTLDGEPSYEQIPWGLHDTLQPYWDENDVRRYAYWEVFAGGCGFTYGHNAVMQFYRPGDQKAYGAKTYWYQAIDAPGAEQMKYLKQLMLSRPDPDRMPDQSIIHGDQGTKYDYVAVTRGKNFIMVYTYNGRVFSLNMGRLPGESVEATWFNPRTGKHTKPVVLKNSGTQFFDPPGEPANGQDWVLLLDTM